MITNYWTIGRIIYWTHSRRGKFNITVDPVIDNRSDDNRNNQE